MVDYELGNPSPIMFSGDGGGGWVNETSSQPDPTTHMFDQYTQSFNDATTTTPFINPNHDFFHHIQNPNDHILNKPTQTHSHFTSFYDPRVYGGGCTYRPSPSPLLSLEPVGGNSHDQVGFMLMPKPEPYGCSIDFTNSPIGLNLGGRTYFSSAEDDFVNRFYRQSRQLEADLINSPRCQAEGCNADLSHAKHYHRRHKVCEFHSKASTVVAAGLTQRFCQQCSRFHLLPEFDDGKRSCRKRLADHNRRRRKSARNQANEVYSKSTSKNLASSGAQSSFSLTIGVSTPQTSFECFQTSTSAYQANTSTS